MNVNRSVSPLRRPAPRVAHLATVALVLLPLAACSDSTGPSVPGAEREILLVSDATGGSDGLVDVFRVKEDGSEFENLTNQPAPIYRDIRISPDGARVAVESDRVTCYNIWVVNLTGTGVTLITGAAGDRCNVMPRWSGDGSRIAFSTSREDISRSWEVYVAAALGTDPHNVSDDAGLDDGGGDWAHGWTPDGRLVFHHQGTGAPRAFVVDADGSGLQEMWPGSGGYAPFWSPNGSRVAFVTERDGNAEIYVMNSDGSAVTNVTLHSGDDTFAHGGRTNLYVDPWSPDGSMLAFTTLRDGNREIYVMNADGTGLRNVTGDPGEDRFDGWSADGTRLLFESNRGGAWHVYTIGADGMEERQVTSGTANHFFAVWAQQ